MTDITIPPAALEAALAEVLRQNEHLPMPVLHDACLAMLKNWPGMCIHEWQRPWLGGMSGTDIILPLPEKTDALRQARADALEEAAQAARSHHRGGCNCLYCYGREDAEAAIRALKGEP